MATCSYVPLKTRQRDSRQTVLLGFDGMDPTMLTRLVHQGRMPNAARLMAGGGFAALRTSDPPQSPVAWANVIAGTNPGGHGIFDFIARDPGTLQPYLSTSRIQDSARTLAIGPWRLPLGRSDVANLRRGPCLWSILEDHGVPCTVIRMPSDFPATQSSGGTLSGMGTPDLHGAYGVFTYYTDALDAYSHEVPGGRIERVVVRDHVVESLIPGPANPLDTRQASCNLPLHVFLDPARPTARIRVQDADFILREGEWSDWLRLRFDLLRPLVTVSGICRFYLKRARNDFQLYVSPINIDPADPSLPIAAPSGYGAELERHIGPFYTQGMAEDTSALTAGVFDDAEYRTQAEFVFDESMRLFEHTFNDWREGFYFFYFSSLDQNQHMFWRAIDPLHPLYCPELAAAHGDYIDALYVRLDRVLGEVLDACGPDTLVMAISDHGFSTFRRQFNLNSWLLDQGYAHLRHGATRGHGEFFADTDWGRTQAYGLGINSLYLNLRGREPDGSVETEERDALLRRLARHLEQVVDPDSGQRIIRRVYRPEEIYSGPLLHEAPDLVIGYNPAYRASWDTILGAYPHQHVLDNLAPWSGDHCIDSLFMSGVCLANRPLRHESPSLSDVAPTFLDVYGVPAPAAMTGKTMLQAHPPRS